MLRRTAASASWALRCSISSRRARSTAMALARFLIWLFSSWISTTRPLGRWVMRTAESVVLTLWPPGPGGALDLHPQVLVLVDLDLHLVGLGQDGHRGGRRVDAAG